MASIEAIREEHGTLLLHAIVLIILAVMLSIMVWELVHSAPPILSRVLPRGLTVGAGLVMLMLGVWAAFTGAYVTRDPGELLFSLVRIYVGLWFLLAPSAGMRGSESDQRFLKRIFAMVAVVMSTLIASLYLDNPQATTALQLVMVAAGFWLTMNYLRLTDRGG